MKLTMAVPISTRSEIKQQRQKQLRKLHRRRALRMAAGVLILGVLAILFINLSETPLKAAKDITGGVLAAGLSANDELDLTPLPTAVPTSTATVEPNSPPEESQIILPAATEPPVSIIPVQLATEPPPLATQAQMVRVGEDVPLLYYAQSGDSLGVLSVRFGVEASDITSNSPLPADGLISEGQLLIVPNRLEETTSKLKLFPDSEVVNSPSAIGVDVTGFINQAGGYLSTYQESVYYFGMMSGADIIEKVALEFSIHPRLLLALLEYQSGWVYGTPQTSNQIHYPLGLVNQDRPGLYNQLQVAAGIIESGYYGWREGTMVVLDFPDGYEVRLAAELNCGTVGLMYYFAQARNFSQWVDALYSDNSFFNTYEYMFGDPWMIAQYYEPLFTPDVVQPELLLPFDPGVTWVLTVGPHAAWGAADVRAALDFGPPTSQPGCFENWTWVAASASGLVVRSENGVVVIDLDGDGYEQTGWNLIYLHIATAGRIPVGTWVQAGDHIGHPSCEGGISTGTHLHMVRKYNGEWVPAEGPLPFVLSGWRAKAGPDNLSGWLVRGDEVVRASIVGASSSHISR